MKYALYLTFSVFMILGVSSCGDDDITGCTDPNADNFNPEATVSGDCVYSGCTDPDAENYNAQATVEDNSCVFARDKFIGNYLGAFTCGGIIGTAVNSDSVFFSIEPALDADLKNGVIITLMDISGFDIPLSGTAEGNMLTGIEAELLGIPVIGITSDVTGVGSATIDGTVLDASVTLTITNAVLGSQEATCTLIGNQQ